MGVSRSQALRSALLVSAIGGRGVSRCPLLHEKQSYRSAHPGIIGRLNFLIVRRRFFERRESSGGWECSSLVRIAPSSRRSTSSEKRKGDAIWPSTHSPSERDLASSRLYLQVEIGGEQSYIAFTFVVEDDGHSLRPIGNREGQDLSFFAQTEEAVLAQASDGLKHRFGPRAGAPDRCVGYCVEPETVFLGRA